MKTKESLEKQYKSNIDTYRNAIVAWKNVKRLTKKDGSDFANFGKNFANATVKQEYSWSNDMVISVDYKYGHSGSYTYDSITISEDDSVNSVIDKIGNRIKLFEGYIKTEEKKVKNVDKVFSEVDETMKHLTKFCKDNGFSAYEVCDYIKDNCWRMD